MSAFVVNKEHIDLIVSTMIELKVYVRNPLGGDSYNYAAEWSADDLGRVLWGQNVKSVQGRYPAEQFADDYRDVSAYTFKRYHGLKWGPIGTLVSSLDYQCCDADDWETTLAFHYLTKLNEYLVKKLPGTGEAPGGAYPDKLDAFCAPGMVSLLDLATRAKRKA
jgi:hypothetical protein